MIEKRGLDWRLLALVWGLASAAFIARALFNAETTPLLADTDDAMRMVVVRDLLAGQGWYDNIQHRMNAPFGAELHWSRLADLPLAGLLLILRPLAGAASETIAAWAFPLLYLAGLLWFCARLALKLAGAAAVLPALILPVVSLTVLGEFVPGRIDHHSLQILLLLALLWCTLEALERPRFAIGAGLAAATGLAIGIESLPGVAAAILAFGLLWVADPTRAPALRHFGLSFALGTLAHLLVGVPPGRWFVPMCDAISLTYAVMALATGSAFILLSVLPLARVATPVRLAAGLAAGLAVAVTLALLFPHCLRGPYGNLDPWLLTHWIDRIGEAQPWWVSFMRDPVYPLAVAVPPLAALVATAVRIGRGPAGGRAEWLIYAVFLILTTLVMLLQIRGSRLVTCLAVPACAWLIAAARERYRDQHSLGAFAGLALGWLVSSGLAVALLVSAIVLSLPNYAAATADPSAGARRQCLMPAAFAALAARPPTIVMGPVDLGAHLLAFTRHSVVAAPYHRAEQGVRATFEVFHGPLDRARAILRERGVTLLVVCPAMPELRGFPDAADDSLARLLAAGTQPAWLVDQSAPGAALRIYAVTP